VSLFRRSSTGLFASESLLGHLLRGAIASGLLAWAIQHQTESVLPWLAALGALVTFRGCPMCWTVGLVETLLQQRTSPRSVPDLPRAQVRSPGELPCRVLTGLAAAKSPIIKACPPATPPPPKLRS
jgi:hypothetical protein